MEIERLKVSHIKRNIIIGVIAVLIISAIVLNFTRAKYRVTDSIEIVNGTVNYTPYDFKVIAIYQEQDGEYVEIESMPSSGYTINEEMSYCTLDNVNHDNDARLYTNANGEHVISGLKKNSKCYLYFDEVTTRPVETILGTIQVNLDEPDFSKTAQASCSDTSTCEETNGIYEETTSKGTTYYYRGAVDNNWVYFAGFYWRIIRINEDGSIRMIYQGTSADATETGTQLQTSAFNSSIDNNMYVGYMYTSGQVHGLGTPSTIKEVLDEWYKNNLRGYASSISTEAGFCGDRQPSTSTSSSNGFGGTGTTQTFYGANYRLGDTREPTFECQNNSDLYTVSSSTGNGALDYPVGLISLDEAWYAGGTGTSSNNSFYLYTGQMYWTMSPHNFVGYGFNKASLYLVSSDGRFSGSGVDNAYGIRPVISLSTNNTITGSGTINDPYVVS